MEFDLLLRGIEYISRREVYLTIAALIFLAMLIISIFSYDSVDSGFGYIAFCIVLCAVLSLLWPLSAIVALAAYINVTLGNIKENKKKYKKLCGIIDC